LADDDEAIEKYRNVDRNCETEIKFHIRSDLGPWLAIQSPEDRNQMKRSIQELLHDTDFDFGAVFDNLLPPFDHPTNPHELLRWIWEVIWSGNESELADSNNR
jgi:hypothetical protein